MDKTLRTKDDCEALCLTSAEFQHSDLYKFLSTNANSKNEFSVKSHAAPLIRPVEAIKLNGAEQDAFVIVPSNGEFGQNPKENKLARKSNGFGRLFNY
jgi:hypothetical protein